MSLHDQIRERTSKTTRSKTLAASIEMLYDPKRWGLTKDDAKTMREVGVPRLLGELMAIEDAALEVTRTAPDFISDGPFGRAIDQLIRAVAEVKPSEQS